tara:strand:+ start:33 stop:212 length:180 start_codon:yes stop_codon:yes gene_type:complete
MSHRKDKEKGIICPMCKEELIWGADFDYEDYGLEGTGIVGNYTCKEKMCHVEDVKIFTK